MTIVYREKMYFWKKVKYIKRLHLLLAVATVNCTLAERKNKRLKY